jgi:hypothetical protein
MDNDIKELFTVLLQEQAATARSIGDLAVTVNQYVASADTRLRNLEASLDALIKAITSEHKNGKAH